MSTAEPRAVQQIINAMPTNDGDGVRIERIAGRKWQALLDPFLMLDEIRSDDSADYIGGFPPHPHRGFETITYMLHGQLRHRDHLGNEGLVGAGGVQWMTAGRGIIHSEMPEQDEGLLHGMQLWLNLPARDKLCPPQWRDVQKEEVPQMALGKGNCLSVLAGSLNADSAGQIHTLAGPIQTRTEVTLADIQLAGQTPVTLDTPATHTVLLFVIEGAINGIERGQMGVFTQGTQLSLSSHQPARALYLAGKPLREPIAQHGPFVMNTMAEIEQAIVDYQQGRF